jgi:hypothetical protein
MAELKITRKKSGSIISNINQMLTSTKVDAMDRTPVTELAFAELIAATLPLAPQGQDVADFYRTNCIEGVKAFLDQAVELVSISQEQCLLAVYGVYAYRVSMIQPENLTDVRPCIGRYIRRLPQRHADMVMKYPTLNDNYWALADSIYV